MAFVRDYSFDSIATDSLSFTGTLPTYETGDLLVWFVAKDSTAGGFNTTPTGWTLLDEWSDNAIKGSVFYKENVTGGSETNPQTSNTDTDTWTGVLVSVGGVPTSSTIEANTRIDTTIGVGCERVFTGPTTLTNNALVLHGFLNSAQNGCATDQKLQVVSEEVGFINESVYLFKETIPTAGASAAGNFLQYANTATTYIGLSIVDGSSGADIEPYQSGGGMTSLINGFQGQETLSWMPTGFPSGIVTDAFTTYGNLTTVNGALADRYQDAADKGVSFYLAGATTRGDRSSYQGLRFQADRTGGLATYDISTKKIIGCCHLDVAKTSVQFGSRDVMGIGIFVEDNAGNWKCFGINGYDSERIFINSFDGPFLIDLTNGVVLDSSGTLDETNIQYIGVVIAGLNSNNLNVFFSNFAVYEPIEIVGGTSTQPVTYDRINSIGYANLHRFRKVQGGASQLVGAWHIGDGIVDTHLNIANENISLPEASNNGGCLIEQGFMGFKFMGTANSNLSFTDTIISSPSQWKWNQDNGLGTQTYTNLQLTRAKPLTVDSGDYTRSTFTQCGQITQNTATLTNCTIDNSLDSIGLTLGTGNYDGLAVNNCTTGIEVDTAGSITLTNVTFSGNTTDIDFSTTGTLNIDIVGGDIPTTSATGGGTVNVTQNVNITAPNLIDDTRVQLYNVTKDAELDNSVVSGGSGYSYTANLQGAGIDDGDTIRIRATYINGTTAKNEFESSGVVSTIGLSFIGSQEDCEVYNANAIDGSGITNFAADYIDNEVDVIVSSNFTAAQFYAWWKYNLTLEDGIRNFFGGVTDIDAANYRINTTVVNIFFDKTTSANIYQDDNARIYRDDSAYPVKNPTTGGGAIDLVWREKVLVSNANEIWNADLISGSYTGGSAGNIIKNIPRVITKNRDL